MSRFTLLLIAAGMAIVGLVFGLWPRLDLAVAGMTYANNGFAIAQSPAAGVLRSIGYVTPLALLGFAIILYGLRRAGLARLSWPDGPALAFMIITMILGPGLVVNLGLKDHWRRPRPSQIEEFGGSLAFRPWYRLDGACQRNCSFVSGEGATAFWTVAPALTLAPPLQPVAIAAAVTFGIVVSALRIAFGGHFLSDTLFAALISLLIVGAVGRRMGFRRASRGQGVARTASRPPDES